MPVFFRFHMFRFHMPMRRYDAQASFFLFQQVVDLADQFHQLLWILLYRRSRAQLHPAFFGFAIHGYTPPFAPTGTAFHTQTRRDNKLTTLQFST